MLLSDIGGRHPVLILENWFRAAAVPALARSRTRVVTHREDAITWLIPTTEPLPILRNENFCRKSQPASP